jgi:hypothetical protein
MNSLNVRFLLEFSTHYFRFCCNVKYLRKTRVAIHIEVFEAAVAMPSSRLTFKVLRKFDIIRATKRTSFSKRH